VLHSCEIALCLLCQNEADWGERFGYCCVFSVSLDPSFLVSKRSSVLATLEEPVGTWVE